MPTYLLTTPVTSGSPGQSTWTDSTLVPTAPVGPAGGDLSGTYPNPLVDGLQGQPVSPLAPINGQILTFTAGAWTPVTPPAAPLLFQGTWNASTGLPPAPAATTAGQAWVVSVAGNTNLGGITDWQVGDWAVYGGAGAWYKLDNTSWDTTGNVVGGGQFIGSTNAADVVLKRNNLAQLTLSGTGLLAATGLDMANNLITNIGNAGTDFTAGGGLTLASTLTVSAGGASITGATTIATGVGNLSISSTGASTINLGATNLTIGAANYSLGAGTWNIAAQTLTATGNLSFSGADVVLTPTNSFEIRSAKQIRWYNAGNTFYTSMQAPALAANVSYTLPLAQGAASTFLQNDGAGNLSWAAASSLAWSLTGNSGTNPGVNFAGTTDAVDFVLRASNVERLRALSAGGVSVLNGPLNLTNTGTAAELRLLEPSGSGTNYTAFKAQAQAADITYTLPAAQGAASTFLRNDGTGVLSWATAGLTFFTEAQSTVAPNDIVYANSLTAVAAVADADFVIKAKGAGAILAQIPDGLLAGGNKRGQYAVDLQMARSAANQVAESGYSVVVGGLNNRSANTAAVVVGGTGNRASGSNSFVGGGNGNISSATEAAITGGNGNTAGGSRAFVGGGAGNNASGATYPTIAGGGSNTASGSAGAICGGESNTASSSFAFVGGGQSNTASTNTHASVVGGFTNTASGQYSFVGGGANNQATGERSFIGGGGSTVAADRNTATATAATVAGGENNDATGTYAFIGGGIGNRALSPGIAISIGGGGGNTANGNYSTIGGGSGNNVGGGQFTTVGGGTTNSASAEGAVVAGGRVNTASGLISAIGGGQENTASATYTTVSGGAYNRATASWATVAGGGGSSLPFGNTATATAATVSGGQTNNATGTYSAVSGGQTNTSGSSYSAIPGGLQASTRFTGEVGHASGQFAAPGDAQNSFVVSRLSLAVGANGFLTFDGGAPVAGNSIVLTNNTMYQFYIKVAARDTAAVAQFAWWDISGGIGQDGAPGTTALVGANVVNTGSLGANAATWTCVAVANAVAGSLDIQVAAPAGAGPVRFVASVYLTRVA